MSDIYYRADIGEMMLKAKAKKLGIEKLVSVSTPIEGEDIIYVLQFQTDEHKSVLNVGTKSLTSAISFLRIYNAGRDQGGR